MATKIKLEMKIILRNMNYEEIEVIDGCGKTPLIYVGDMILFTGIPTKNCH